MAGKKNLEADYPSFDMDLDLDFSTDISSELNQEVNEPKKRSVIGNVAKGVIQGTKDTLTSPQFIHQTLKKALPSAYGEITESLGEVSQGSYELYDQTVRELKPRVNRIMSKIDSMVPETQKGLKSITKKIVERTGTSTYSNFDNRANQEEQTVNQLSEQIFGQGFQQENPLSTAKGLVKEEIEKKRFESSSQLLGLIANNTSIQAQYTTSVTQRYQKKMLELQLRGFLSQQEYYRQALKYNELNKAQNEAIIKNTSLPEYLKITNSERFMEMTRNKFFESLYGEGSVLKKGMDRLKETAKEFVGGISLSLENIDMGLDAAQSGKEQVQEMNKMLIDMGEEPLTSAEMAGAAVAGSAISYFRDIVTKRIRNRTEASPRINENISKLANILKNPSGSISELQKQDWWQENLTNQDSIEGKLTKAGDFILEHFKDRDPSREFGRNELADELGSLSSPMMGFDKKAHISLVDVIPGHLSAIHREIAMMRTGSEDVPLQTYDYQRGEFVSKKQLASRIKESLSTQARKSEHGYKLNKASEYIAQEHYLDDDDQIELKRFLSRLSRIGNIQYSKENIENTNAYQSLSPSVKKLIDRQLSLMSDGDKKEATSLEFTRQIQSIRQATPSLDKNINDYIQAGYGDALAETGIVKKTDSGSFKVDEEAYAKFLEEEGVIRSDINVKQAIREMNPSELLKTVSERFSRIKSSLQKKPTLYKTNPYQLNPYPSMDESFSPLGSDQSKKWSPQEAFKGFKKTKLYNWFYQPGKGDKEPHSGPMAQEVRKNFGEEVAPGGKQIDLQSMNGATMAAIKHLGDQVDKLGKGGRKVTNDGLLYQIRQDTASIVKLLSAESKRLGKVTQSSTELGTIQGEEKQGYRTLLTSTFKNILDLATQVSGDVYGAASRVFTVGKDKVAKPTLDFVTQSFNDNKSAIKEGLSHLFSKATSLAGSALELGQKTLTEYLPAGFKQLKGFAQKTVEGLSRLINSAKDLYLPGQVQPVIQAFKLKAGHYYDSATGKVIESIDQLLEAKENIVDKLGNVILTAEDKAQGLYDRNGEKVKSAFIKVVKGVLGAGAYVKDKITDTIGQLKEGGVKTFGQFKDFIKNKTRDFGGIGTGFSKASHEVLVDIRDILLGDKESVLERLKKKPKGSSPLTQETSQVIVEQETDNNNVTTDGIQTQAPNTSGFLGGLIDTAKGIGGKLSGLKGKLLGKTAGTVATAATTATSVGKGILGKGLGLLKGIGGGLGAAASGLGGLLSSSTAQSEQQPAPKEKPEKPSSREILIKKAPGEKAWNDKDGDGRRDGSVEERQEKLDELKRSRTKQGPEADLTLKYKQGNIFDNLLGKLGGLFSFLSSGFTGVMSLLGSGFTKLTGLGGILTKTIGSAVGMAGRAAASLGSLATGAGGLLGSAKAGLSAVGGKIASGVGSAIGGIKGLFGAGAAASGATGVGAAAGTSTGASTAGATAAAAGTAAKTGILGKAAGLFNAAKTGVAAIGSKAASIGGTVLRTGLQMGARGAAFMATKALPGAIMAGAKLAGAAVTSIAGALATPVVIGGAALTLAGYGIYKLYQRAKRNNANDYERLRLRQYGFGFNSDVDQYNHHVYILEEYLQDGRLSYEGGKVSINERRVNPEDLAEIFNIDKDDQEAGERFAYWYVNRFTPVFLTHMTALYAVDGKKKLNEVKDLDPSSLIKYLEATALPEGPYNVTVSPLKALSELSNEQEKIRESTSILISNLRGEASKGSKEAILPEKKEGEPQAPNEPYKSKSSGFLDFITGGAFKEKEPLKEGEKQKDLATLVKEQKAKQATNASQILTGGEAGEDGPQNQQTSQTPSKTTNDVNSATPPSTVPEATGAPKIGQAGNQFLRLGRGVEIEGSNPIMLKHFLGMAEEYGEKTGKTIQVNSGYRSYEKQAALHRQFPQKAAAPGRSLHESGLAIDINSSDANELEKLGLMKKYGFTRPVGGEPWHIEPAGIQRNIALARDNARERDVMISASLYRGGGGYGTLPNATKYRRNHDLAMRLLDLPGKPVEEPKTDVASSATSTGSKETIMSGSTSVSDRVGGYNNREQSGSPGTVSASMPTGSAVSMNQSTNALNQPAANEGALNTKTATSGQINISQDTTTTAQEKMPTEEQLWNQAQEAEPTPSNSQETSTGQVSGKGGDIKTEIARHAKKVGVDPSLMQAFAVVESDLNPNAKASTSSAAGLYQFIRSTWQEQIAKFGQKYGLKANASPFDVEASTLLASEYIKQNQRYISRVKPDTNFTDLYLTHFLGQGGANKFLSLSPDTIAAQALPQAAAANKPIFYSKSGQPLTVRAIYENLSKKLKDKSASYGVNVNAGQGLKATSQGPGLNPSSSGVLSTPMPSESLNTPSTQTTPKSSSQGLSLPTPPQNAATGVAPTTSSREMYASSSGGVFVDSRGSSMLARERREAGEAFTGPNMGNIETALDKSVGIQQDSLAVLKDILENVKTEKVAEMLAAALASVVKASQSNSADSLKEQDNRNMGRTGRAQSPSLDMSRKVM